MTREEYLEKLKRNLSSLTEKEQTDIVQYYSDYFDDAADDEKIMKEFGSPEELAEIIQKQRAGQVQKTDSEQNEKEENPDYIQFYAFNKKDVRNLSLAFSTAEIAVISGKNFSVETRGLQKEDLNVKLSAEGNLEISNNKRININFWSHEGKFRLIPRILITVPENAKLNRFKIELNAGNFFTKNSSFSYKSGEMELGAGNLCVENITGENTFLRCGMGNLTVRGSLFKKTDIDCGMGAVKLELKQDSNECSFDYKIGLGEFKFNEESWNGIKQYSNGKKKENHFSVNTGLGSVNIQTK